MPLVSPAHIILIIKSILAEIVGHEPDPYADPYGDIPAIPLAGGATGGGLLSRTEAAVFPHSFHSTLNSEEGQQDRVA